MSKFDVGEKHVDAVALYAELRDVGRALRETVDPGRPRLPVKKLDLDQLYSLRLSKQKDRQFAQAAEIGLEILSRETKEAESSTSLKQHTKVVLAVVSLIRGAATGRRAATARGMTADVVAGLERLPPWVVNYLKQPHRSIRDSDLRQLVGRSRDEWNELVKSVQQLNRLRQAPAADRVHGERSEPLDLGVASRLSRIAAREASDESSQLPSYDRSDEKLRLTRVTVEGFRGAAGSVTLDLTKNGKPVDVLIWGDNGVGKSSLADGIEYALQSRVDRSADFNSSLRSSVRNLTVPEASVAAEFNDGTLAVRALTVNEAGRDVPSSNAVRPGFRIAPVVIRRADILRFLDTDAASRGTIFFDYFPDPAGGLGTRPDEQLKVLDEEQLTLRVARADLAQQLREYFPDAPEEFADRQGLESFVERILQDVEVPSDTDPTSVLAPEVRQLIHDLRSVQQRLPAIKKKLDRGIQRFNPVAYKSQLARVVPALRTVGEELTDSFKRITRAEHIVALDVAVASSGPMSLDVVVRFDNGTTALPQQAFSEGYKDLVALLFFMAITKRAGELGQAKVLVLDDALQSVDAGIRLGVMDHILEQFADWQLIVTGHDRAWLSQLRGLYQRRGKPYVERTIAQWSFAGGIQVSGASRLRAETLRIALDQHDVRMSAAAAGILLEEICQELSWRIESGVTRRPGDRYTLGDLWPGIVKTLKKTELKGTLDDINLRLDVRNLLGAHFNEDADSIPWSDVKALAEDVLSLYERVYCSRCGSWIAKPGLACNCAVTTLL